MPVMEAEAKEGAAEAASFYGQKDNRFRNGSPLNETQWRQLIARSIKGESDSDLSRAFGVQGGTIRQRRYSDPVWQTAHNELKNTRAMVAKAATPIKNEGLSLREIGEASPTLLAQVAHTKILEAIELGTIPQIQSWSEVKTAMEIIRKSCNLDSNTTNVQVNLWSGSPASQAPSVVMDAEIVPDKCSDEEWI